MSEATNNPQSLKEAHFLQPPDHIFLYKKLYQETVDRITPPGTTTYLTERVEYPPGGGIAVWYKGMKYPSKGFPFTDAMAGITNFKRTLRSFSASSGQATWALLSCPGKRNRKSLKNSSMR